MWGWDGFRTTGFENFLGLKPASNAVTIIIPSVVNFPMLGSLLRSKLLLTNCNLANVIQINEFSFTSKSNHFLPLYIQMTHCSTRQ